MRSAAAAAALVAVSVPAFWIGLIALASLATLVGWMVGSLFGGAVLIETVFARPGLGRVLLSAVTSRDLPVVSAVVLLVAGVFVVVDVVVDLRIDPRLRTPRSA